MLDSLISCIGPIRVEINIRQRDQLKRPGANGSAVYHCHENRQERGTSDGHEGGDKHSAIAGKADGTSKNAANHSARDTHRQIHPHTIALPLKAFAGKPSSGEPNENPDRNLHVFSSADNLRKENRARLAPPPLPTTHRHSPPLHLLRW